MVCVLKFVTIFSCALKYDENFLGLPRGMRPNTKCSGLCAFSARSPRETVQAIQQGDEVLKA